MIGYKCVAMVILYSSDSLVPSTAGEVLEYICILRAIELVAG